MSLDLIGIRMDARLHTAHAHTHGYACIFKETSNNMKKNAVWHGNQEWKIHILDFEIDEIAKFVRSFE